MGDEEILEILELLERRERKKKMGWGEEKESIIVVFVGRIIRIKVWEREREEVWFFGGIEVIFKVGV